MVYPEMSQGMGQLSPGQRPIPWRGPRLSLNKMVIKMILIVECCSRKYPPKSYEFQNICQLATLTRLQMCDVIVVQVKSSLSLPPCTIITHFVERRQSVDLLQLEPVRLCLDALEELEPLTMYQENPPL
ncbi:hypothetical protein TNCV_4511521 [Trichonephila clavipes]|nr:hypothetical protein TNCV_4511521 [Trichonephila clavipes]